MIINHKEKVFIKELQREDQKINKRERNSLIDTKLTKGGIRMDHRLHLQKSFGVCGIT